MIVAAAATTVAPRAEDLTGYAEVTASDFESRQRVAGVPSVPSRTDAIGRRLYLSFRRQLFPRLALWGGGTFDDIDTTTRDSQGHFDNEITRLRPYFGLRRQTPTQHQQLLWSRDQTRTAAAGGPAVTTVRDGWFLTSGWRRPRLPNVRLSLFRTRDRDLDLGTLDRAAAGADLTATHAFGPPLRATYRGSLSGQDDFLADTSIRSQAHTANLRFDDAWLDRRIALNTEYAVIYRSSQQRSATPGSLVLPLFPVTGLAARDETPLQGVLPPEPTLIDDDTATGGPVDLGLPGAGEDDTPWSLGLELEPDTTTNVVYVWIDREIVADVAASFQWAVFTSLDGLNWTPREVVGDAPFDTLLKRFEIRFADVATPYVKLGVAPLSAGVPFATDYPDLLVTELEAAFRAPFDAVRLEQSETIHTLAANTRVRLLAARDLHYEGHFQGSRSNDRPERWRISNGLSYAQPLGDGYAFSGRVAVERERRTQRVRETRVYAATLAVTPAPRLRYTLALSGNDAPDDDPEAGDTVSLYLYALAGLYEGVDVQVGVGRSYEDAAGGATREATQVTATARIVPTADWTFGLSYLDTTSEQISAGAAGLDSFSRSAECTAAYAPVPTIYAQGSYRLEWLVGADRDRIANFQLSWMPLPAGMLRVGINYHETRRSELSGQERVFGPNLRWNLNRRSYLQVTWQDVRDESAIRRADDEILAATLRWGF